MAQNLLQKSVCMPNRALCVMTLPKEAEDELAYDIKNEFLRKNIPLS